MIPTEENAQYDEILEDASEILVYTYPEMKSIEECLAFVKEASGKENLAYEQLGTSYKMTVYKIYESAK